MENPEELVSIQTLLWSFPLSPLSLYTQNLQKWLLYYCLNTGTMWTASAHIITAIIGSGVLSLAWSIAQLGWIAGVGALLAFSCITYYTSGLLADCYRYPHPVNGGKRNYTYKAAVRAYLGNSLGHAHTTAKNPQFVFSKNGLSFWIFDQVKRSTRLVVLFSLYCSVGRQLAIQLQHL